MRRSIRNTLVATGAGALIAGFGADGYAIGQAESQDWRAMSEHQQRCAEVLGPKVVVGEVESVCIKALYGKHPTPEESFPHEDYLPTATDMKDRASYSAQKAESVQLETVKALIVAGCVLELGIAGFILATESEGKQTEDRYLL
jgi:hypothetical protein